MPGTKIKTRVEKPSRSHLSWCHSVDPTLPPAVGPDVSLLQRRRHYGPKTFGQRPKRSGGNVDAVRGEGGEGGEGGERDKVAVAPTE